MKPLDCPHCGEPISSHDIAQAMGREGGSKSTPAKRRASRLNGLKGGRPPKRSKVQEKENLESE